MAALAGAAVIGSKGPASAGSTSCAASSSSRICSCCGIPADLPPQFHGDVAQVAEACRAMSGLHGLDRIFARLHAIEEVPHVIVRDRAPWARLSGRFSMPAGEVDFLGADLRILQRLGRSLNAVLSELDPTFGPFKADAEAPFRGLADQLDAVGIRARKATFLGVVKRSPGANHSEPRSSNSTGPLRSAPRAHCASPLQWAPKFVVCPPE